VPATLFISDLHLSGERPAINRRFFAFLREQATRASALYVLGDLFEYWIGDEELDAADADPLGRKVAEAFGALSRRGIGVRLMHGNRDFLLGKRFCDVSGARLLEDPAVEKVGGARTLLMHGDTLCTDDIDYQAWRGIARPRSGEFLAKRSRAAGGARDARDDRRVVQGKSAGSWTSTRARCATRCSATACAA
jgi:UDP-2,3-diacylglucosamine hydrolase